MPRASATAEDDNYYYYDGDGDGDGYPPQKAVFYRAAATAPASPLSRAARPSSSSSTTSSSSSPRSSLSLPLLRRRPTDYSLVAACILLSLELAWLIMFVLRELNSRH
jgi:hypothetical protein